jgi:Fe-S cluster assembly protein SufB
MENVELQRHLDTDYRWGFVTDIEQDTLPMVHARLAAQGLSALADHDRARLVKRALPGHRLPDHALLRGAPRDSGPKSLAEVDPELLATYEKLGIPLAERGSPGRRGGRCGVRLRVRGHHLQGQAGDELGIIFCSFSEAVHKHPELVRQYLGSVVPYTDNFFAGLNSAVFSDGSFVYVPKGVRCPMELSTYFRINAATPASSSAP